jgi:hypothetical protein
MIRRNPTLIAMSDSDVQDVRELVRKKKEAAQAAQASHLSQANALGTSISTDPSKPAVAPEEAKRKRDGMTKEERLGL